MTLVPSLRPWQRAFRLLLLLVVLCSFQLANVATVTAQADPDPALQLW